MICRLGEIRSKEVISMRDGARIGFVGDLELDSTSARVTALVIPGRPRLFGLLGREEDTVIFWEKVAIVGEETILVQYDMPLHRSAKRDGVLANWFGKI